MPFAGLSVSSLGHLLFSWDIVLPFAGLSVSLPGTFAGHGVAICGTVGQFAWDICWTWCCHLRDCRSVCLGHLLDMVLPFAGLLVSLPGTFALILGHGSYLGHLSIFPTGCRVLNRGYLWDFAELRDILFPPTGCRVFEPLGLDIDDICGTLQNYGTFSSPPPPTGCRVYHWDCIINDIWDIC